MAAKPLPRDRITFRYKPQFGVIVLCANEQAQRRVFGKLRRLGYSVRVVTV